jgi:CheY-like chemotaxis protein
MGSVLIIDDDKDQRQKYRKLFKDNGIDVLEAPDALEVGMTLMRELSNIDLILLDLQMPDIDGREIYEIIQDYTTKKPIIVASVYPVNEQKLRISRARDYFQKSDGDTVLLKKVKNILGMQ